MIWQILGLVFVQTGSPSYLASQHNLCKASIKRMEKQKEGSGREKGPFVMVAEYKLYGTDISYDSIYFSYLKKKGGGGSISQ